ncbi:MAG TPA: anti-sigma factor [Dehalococcoidia bacterium]|nr:anti-sigma factor [Dehalococcoidia bacterium]
MDCETVRDDLDAWAIGALDGEELAAVEAHLASCAECSALAEEAAEAAGALALAVPLVRAPEALGSRILAAAQVLEYPRSPPRGPNWWQAAAAVFIVAGAGLLAWSAYLQAEVNDLSGQSDSVAAAATSQGAELATLRTELTLARSFTTDLATSQDAMMTIMSQDDVSRTPLDGTDAAPDASGRYVWSASERLGALVATGLPALDPGETYQMWAVYDGEWKPAGTFGVDAEGNGRLVVTNLSSGGSGRPVGFAVSLEPVAGSDRPTGPIVLQSAEP